MVWQTSPSSINVRDLLETLRGEPLLGPFRLTVFCLIEGAEASRAGSFELCASDGGTSQCTQACDVARETAFKSAISTGKPVIFRCPCNTLNFAVPFHTSSSEPYCLLAEEISVSFVVPADQTASQASQDPLVITPSRGGGMERSEAERIAFKIQRLLPSMIQSTLAVLSLEKTTQRIKTLTDISAEIDLVQTSDEVISLLCETSAILFDLTHLSVIFGEPAGNGFVLKRVVSWPGESVTPAANKIAEFLRLNSGGRPVQTREDIEILFPGTTAQNAVCVPLVSGDMAFGLAAFFEAQFHPRDLLLLELLCAKAASRLLILKMHREHQQEAAFSTRLVTMISALSLLRKREEVYQNIVEMASELLDATCGSLMLFDERGENLQIESAKGMNLPLARSLSVKVGTGIAGRVAKSGFPMVVNDIEKDRRTASPNRPRFKTKSFISVPLKIKDRTVGVLNLSDKADQGIFTENDLNMLTSFTTQISIILERAASLERADMLEKLAATDALTGLYNRRYLDERLDEELSRSTRHSLNFSLMLIDLDNFKIYNDQCGHIAGDNALKKVASLLRSSARDIDIVARFGGEEFMVLLPDTGKKEATFVAERIRKAIESHPFPREASLPGGKLTTSIGVSTFPDDGDFPSSLVNAADIALYQAKNQGRNLVIPFTRQSNKDNIVFL